VPEADALANALRDLVRVHRQAFVEVDHRLDHDLVVTQQLSELAGEERAEVVLVILDAYDAGAGGQGEIGQVHVERVPTAAPGPGRTLRSRVGVTGHRVRYSSQPRPAVGMRVRLDVAAAAAGVGAPGRGPQIEGGLRVGQPADCLGAALVLGVGVIELGQHVGEMIGGGVEPDHVSGRGFHDDGLGAVQVGLADPDAALLGARVRVLLGQLGVGVHRGGAHNPRQPSRCHGLHEIGHAVIDQRGRGARQAGGGLGDLARARQAGTAPAMIRAQILGWR
jgi:hypothetical protein